MVFLCMVFVCPLWNKLIKKFVCIFSMQRLKASSRFKNNGEPGGFSLSQLVVPPMLRSG
jgi:hypothetical protein